MRKWIRRKGGVSDLRAMSPNQRSQINDHGAHVVVLGGFVADQFEFGSQRPYTMKLIMRFVAGRCQDEVPLIDPRNGPGERDLIPHPGEQQF